MSRKEGRKGKGVSLEEVPMEVQKVWVIQWAWKNSGIGVGLQMYQECIETIKKYPQYFKEENEYIQSLTNGKDNNKQ